MHHRAFGYQGINTWVKDSDGFWYKNSIALLGVVRNIESTLEEFDADKTLCTKELPY